MIRIKACKLSEIIDASVIYLLYILVCVFFIKLMLMTFESIDFLTAKMFIENNFLNTSKQYNEFSKGVYWKEAIYAQFPKANINSKKDTEDLKAELVENEFKNSYLNDIKNDILDTEKLSETKVRVGTVKIENYTKRELDLEELSKSLSVDVSKNSKVLIYHTHTSESYSDVGIYSDYYRTTDKTNNVVSVGNKLVQELEKYGMHAVQDTTVHDYLSFGKAYEASLKTIKKRMNEDKYDILIDIHRDALAANETFRPTAEINGETVAKLMFVIGTDTAGLTHDKWMENLKFAIAFQERANQMYPGLFRDIHLSTSRYNQHMSNKALIVEVGATGNTVEEAQASMKYFASVLNSMI